MATMIAAEVETMTDLGEVLPPSDVTLIATPTPNESPIVTIDDAPPAIVIVPLSDVSPSVTPTPLDLPGVITGDAPSTSGTGSLRKPARRSARQSSRRKPSKSNLKKRALEAFQEIEYATALLSASKFCNFF